MKNTFLFVHTTLSLASALFVSTVLRASAWISYPGLMQAKTTDLADWDHTNAGKNNFEASIIPVEPVPGPVMLDIQADENNAATQTYTNPWTGSTYAWNRQYTMWSYKGKIYLEEGTTYAFGKLLDDGARVVIEGQTILENTNWNQFVAGTYTATRTGWHDILINGYDGTGGKGPYGSPWNNAIGFGWNKTGNTSSDLNAAGWVSPRDPGDASLFCCLDEAANPIQFRRIEKTASGYRFFAAFADKSATGSLSVALSATPNTVEPLDDASAWDATTSASIATPGAEATLDIEWPASTPPYFAFLASCNTSTLSYQGASPTYFAGNYAARDLTVTPTTDDLGSIIGASIAIDASPDGHTNCLFVAYGPLEGTDSPESWNTIARIGVVPPEATTLEYTMPEGWGDSILSARFFLAEGEGIPFHHQAEYIEANGSQHVALGFPMTDATTIRFTFMYTRYGGGCFLGNNGAPDNNDCRFFLYNQNPYLDFPADHRLNNSYKVPLNTVLSYEIGNYYLKDLTSGSTILAGGTYAFGTHSYPIGIFTSTDYGRIYSIQVLENNTLTHDFIPVVDRDGIACLYDLVTDTFAYTTDGSLLEAYGTVETTSGSGIWVDSAPAITLDTPWLETPPSITRNPDGSYTFSGTLTSGSGSLYALYNDSLTNLLAASATGPITLSETPSNLTPNTTYAYALGTSGFGIQRVLPGPTTFLTGDLNLAPATNASETDLTPGSFTITRPDTATQHDLTVHYSLSGSATPGINFADTLSGTTTIPAGATSVTLTVTPILDATTKADTTLTLTLEPGLYGIGDSATTSLTITELSVPEGLNVWVSPTPGLASEPSNWSAGHAPLPSENILFNGNYSSALCDWDPDATHTVANWTQDASYTGSVSFLTAYPSDDPNAFTNFTITGSATLDGGSWTHPISFNRPDSWTKFTPEQQRAGRLYRLCLSANSLTIGPLGSINVVGKGHSQKNTYAQSCSLMCSHGGCIEGSSSINCYGNPKFPEDLGYASNWGTDSVAKDAAGAGAIKLDIATTCIVHGEINADGEVATGHVTAGAGGSILIQTPTLSGTGSIHANGIFIGNTSYDNGTGGRVAILTDTPVDRSTLSISAAGTTQGQHAANGTVYFHDNTMEYGVLRVENGSTWRPKAYAAQATPDGDWTFDAIFLQGNTYVTIPKNTAITLPNGLASITSTASDPSNVGLTVQGGSLIIPSGPSLISGPYTFAASSPVEFWGDVSLENRARFVGHATLPTQPSGAPGRLFTIHGHLSAPAGTHIDFHGNQICTQSATLAGTRLAPGTYTASDFPDILHDVSTEQTGELLVLGDATVILFQ